MRRPLIIAWVLAACSSPPAAPVDMHQPDVGLDLANDVGEDATSDLVDDVAIDVGMDMALAPVQLTDAQRAQLEELVLPDDFAPPPAPWNRVADDPAAQAFGKTLFFATGYSGALIDGDNDGSDGTLGQRGETGKVSCASCHVPPLLVDTRSPHQQISLATGWVLRRTPTLLDSAHYPQLLWGGREDTFFGQVFGPIESIDEMNSSRLFTAQWIADNHAAEYEALFGPLPDFADTARFPALTAAEQGCVRLPGNIVACVGQPGDTGPYDGLAAQDQTAVTEVVVNMGKALGAYIRQLRCGPGAFDAWITGDEAAVPEAAKRGALLFLDGCVDCHSGPLLTDFDFHNVGLSPDYVAVAFIDLDDEGASVGLEKLATSDFSSTGPYSDDTTAKSLPPAEARHLGAFKTPSLRCIAQHPSFMHTAQFGTLEEVVRFFSRGGHPGGYPGTNELQRLDLTDREIADLVAFIESLEGPGPTASLLTP